MWVFEVFDCGAACLCMWMRFNRNENATSETAETPWNHIGCYQSNNYSWLAWYSACSEEAKKWLNIVLIWLLNVCVYQWVNECLCNAKTPAFQQLFRILFTFFRVFVYFFFSSVRYLVIFTESFRRCRVLRFSNSCDRKR